MKLYSYGEDAFTFWALTKKLDVILHELEDSTPSDVRTHRSDWCAWPGKTKLKSEDSVEYSLFGSQLN